MNQIDNQRIERTDSRCRVNDWNRDWKQLQAD